MKIFKWKGPGPFAIGAAALSLLALNPPALAAPLDKDACAKLAQDVQNMKLLDVDKLMERGPAWAASHLSPAELSLVRQYIDLDEQMKFRCSAPSSLVHLKNLDDTEEENAQASLPGEGEAKKVQAGDDAGQSPAEPRKRERPRARAAGEGAGHASAAQERHKAVKTPANAENHKAVKTPPKKSPPPRRDTAAQ
jgi:hypothetical protein